MATVAVCPNRIELLRMKKKQQFAQRGHKLLKDKLEGLLKDFTGIVQEYALEELERGNITRLMRIKQLLAM